MSQCLLASLKQPSNYILLVSLWDAGGEANSLHPGLTQWIRYKLRKQYFRNFASQGFEFRTFSLLHLVGSFQNSSKQMKCMVFDICQPFNILLCNLHPFCPSCHATQTFSRGALNLIVMIGKYWGTLSVRHLHNKFSRRRKFEAMGIRVEIVRHAIWKGDWGDLNHMLDLVEEGTH